MKISHWWLVLCGLQLLDLGTTALGLQFGASEQNPVGVYALRFGFAGLVVMKIASMSVAFSLAWVNMHLGLKNHARWGLKGGVAMMVVVVATNSYAILRILLFQEG